MEDAKYPFDEINKMVEDSPRFKKVVNDVGPSVIGVAATALSGSEAVGTGVKIAANAARSASQDTFAKTVAHVGFLAGTVILTVAATPVFVVAFPILAIASMFKKNK